MILFTEKEVYSTERYVHRLGTEHYGKRMTLLQGEDANSFEEVDAIPEPPVPEPPENW